MTDAQKQKLMRLLLGSRSQLSDRELAELERRRRRSLRGGSLTRAQVMKRHGITEAEIERRKMAMKAGAKISRKQAMRMLNIKEDDLAAVR